MNIYPPGYRIAGQYEVASRPLMGGMGIVYLCMDVKQDRPVALKTFKPEYLPDRAARDRFLREGTHWVDLGSHTHIVRCHGVEHVGDGREVYLVLELIPKEQGREDASLRSWLVPGQALPVEQALLFALQIANGMVWACSVLPGFVHRDLKPENILVGADRLPGTTLNRLRVTDFGLAHTLEAAPIGVVLSGEQPADQAFSRTQLTHGIAGTPRYMAPEQWLVQATGVFTDVYALGCILYEMLSGQFAMAGHSIAELQEVHCREKRPSLPSSLPIAVRDLVDRCLAVRVEERFDSWEALSTALEQASGKSLPQVSAEAMSREERVQVGWAFNAMGLSYLDIGKADVARQYFERALKAGETEKEESLRGTVLGNLGIAYTQLGDARRAIEFYEQALVMSHEIGDRRGEGNHLGNLGNAYLQLGDARRAIEFYEQSLTIYREIGDRRGEGSSLNNLGNAYRQLSDARRAVGYFEQALDLFREIGDRHGEGNILGNLGAAYFQLGDARRAIGFHEQALDISREIGDRRGEGNALGNLGNAYMDLGDARRTLGFYEQALAISREIGDLNGTAIASFNMALLYAQQGNPIRALSMAQGSAQAYARIGNPENTRDAQQLVARLQSGQPISSRPSPAQILEKFADLIHAVVLGSQGHAQARAAVEAEFEQSKKYGWRISDPIQRIWAGERDAEKLTSGIDLNSALIIREILKQLSANTLNKP